MKEYFIVWTYIANYGVLGGYPANSPEEAARKFAAGFSDDFQAKGRAFVVSPLLIFSKVLYDAGRFTS